MTDIVHSGVKGMKWGVRKAQPMNSKYTKGRVAQDERTFGKGGVRRINKRLNAGKTYKQAVRREFTLSAGKGVLAVGFAITPIVLQEFGPVIAKSISDRAETNRGRNAVKGLSMKEKPIKAKKNRKGVYKVTDL